MAHFAQLNDNNIVQQVIVVSNNDAPTEEAGQAFVASLGLDGVWKQTSYNTYIDDAGVSQHSAGGTPFRGCYAGIGFTYDAVNDVFIPQGYTYDAVNDVFVAPTIEEEPA